MKKLFPVLVLCAVGAAALGVFLQAQGEQRRDLQTAASATGVPFGLPYDARFADSAKAYRALAIASEAADANVFRTVIAYDTRDEPQITHYVLLQGQTRLTNWLPLGSGRFLTPDETQHGNALVANSSTGDRAQVGRIRSLPGTTPVAVRPLEQAFAAVPVAGQYYAEPTGSADSTAFISALAKSLSEQFGVAVSAEDLKPLGGLNPGSPGNSDGVVRAAYLALLLLVVLLAIYVQLHEAKRDAVLRLHGFSASSAWYAQSGRLVLALGGAVTVVAAVTGLVLPGGGVRLASGMAAQTVLATGLVAVGTWLARRYLLRVPLANSLKNRKDTRGLLRLNSAVKGVCAVAVIVTGAGLWNQYQSALDVQSSLQVWAKARDYGVFYPTNLGNDVIEAQSGFSGPTAAEVRDLYPRLNGNGALYVDASAYTQEALKQSQPEGAFRSMTVNPNYLKQYPVRGLTGQPVTVPESKKNWVIIVPETLRPQEAALRSFFEEQRRAAAEAARHLTGEATPTMQGPLEIVWAQPGQAVFSYNLFVNPDAQNTVRDPVLQVMTTNNSTGLDRANGITGAIDGALKVRLDGRAAADTLRRLEPELKRFRLDDNLRTLVSMADYANLRQADVAEGIRAILIAASGLLLLLLALAVQGVILAFERRSRMVAVRKLVGFGVLSRHREFFTWLYVAWMLELAVGLLANRAGISPFSTATQVARAGTAQLLGVAALAFAAELVVALWALSRLETRRLNTVLKEEF